MLPLIVLSTVLLAAPGDSDLLTVAEASDFQATSTHAQVMDLLGRIADQSELVHLTEMGRTFEDRPIPLAIIADPPITTAEEARVAGKPIFLAFGDIHAGEVCGKEALLMLARELATTEDHPLLDDLVILLAPIFNGDGNDRMDKNNRRNQVGPAEGMGQRHNAQDLDLNRDFIKLETPEDRALVSLLTEWDPHFVVDTHTTNGSHHRNHLTFAGPTNPSGDAAILAFVRDEMLPAVRERLREHTGCETFFYGNFNRDQTIWATYSADGRYGVPYMGLRGCMSILSEAHAYVSYKDRVLATREFVRELMTYAAEQKERVIELHAQARAKTIEAGSNPQPSDMVGIRHRLAASTRPGVVFGWEMIPGERGRPRPSDVPQDYPVVLLDRFEASLSVRRPLAYILPPGLDEVIEKLRQHGIEVGPFEGSARIEAYTITSIERAERPFQGHQRLTLDVIASDRIETFGEGSMIVRTAQPLGTLVVYLLEPQSVDGLATWNFLDEHIAKGGEFPVYRVRSASDLP